MTINNDYEIQKQEIINKVLDYLGDNSFIDVSKKDMLFSKLCDEINK